MPRGPSHAIRLTRRILLSQGLILALLAVIAISIAIRLNYVVSEDEAISRLQAVVRIDSSGSLVTSEKQIIEAADAEGVAGWAVLQVRDGERKLYGAVPAGMEHLTLDLDQTAEVHWQNAGRQEVARARWVQANGRDVMILAPRGGLPHLSPRAELIASFLVLITLLALLVVSVMSLTTTPSALRKAIAALQGAARQARAIEPTGKTTGLATRDLPLDVLPLVETLNDTLAKLQRAYANQGTFLRDAAHELRTPIAILSLRIEELADDPRKAQLKLDVARLAGVADQLLDLQRAKEQTAYFSPVDISALGRRVLADLAPLAIDSGYQLSMDGDDGPVLVHGDAISIERLLMNLVHNAIRYGGNRGTISVRVSAQRFLEVQDEGDGFPPELSPRVFDPFVRGNTSVKGAGLGLYLVRQIAELHSGVVSVEPGTEQGACVRVQFP